jgi:methionyl-tRNA formyltransferase
VTSGLDVVVLTSGTIGIDVAARVAALPEVRSLMIVTSPVGRDRTPLLTKLRNIYRFEGARGVLDAARARLRRSPQAVAMAELVRARCPSAGHLHVSDFHDPAFHERLRALAPDLGVVVATYRLRPAVFTIPRLGCLNLHLGRAPEFRGSSPGFYEMLQGVGEVGLTIHRVTETLDGGNILLQDSCPLDLAPPGDPVEYLRRYQREVLVPAGARLMADAVARVARGRTVDRPQDQHLARTYRRATYTLKQELRRVVAERRQARTIS